MGGLRKIYILAPFVIGLLVLGACSTSVKFKTMALDEKMLAGYLLKPDGDGPFPAVVMLHGCDGLQDIYRPWAFRLRKWGYVTLRVDSFSPRNESYLCGYRSFIISPSKRGFDAHGARLYLAGLPFVDQNRIAVIGWSHGGSSALWAVSSYHVHGKTLEPFSATIAFYPSCEAYHTNPTSPLLILIGEKDTWTLALYCEHLLKDIDGVTIKVYPEAHHSFDHEFPLHLHKEGHLVGRNDKAAADAYIQVKEFLEKHLK